MRGRRAWFDDDDGSDVPEGEAAGASKMGRGLAVDLRGHLSPDALGFVTP